MQDGVAARYDYRRCCCKYTAEHSVTSSSLSSGGQVRDVDVCVADSSESCGTARQPVHARHNADNQYNVARRRLCERVGIHAVHVFNRAAVTVTLFHRRTSRAYLYNACLT